jgi:hypothetical protein
MTTRLTELAISTTGNITGNVVRTDNYQYANGQPFTGGGGSYGNANVVTFLADFGSNTISTTGNITAGNVIGNVTGSGNLTLNSSGNVVTLGAAGNTWTFNGATSNLTIPAGGAIRTSGGSNGNIILHPDGAGTVIIQGASPGSLLLLQSDTANTQNRIEIDTFGSANNLGGTLTGRFSRGNLIALAAVQAGDQLASLRGKGYDGTAFSAPVGQLSVHAFDNWTSGNVPSQLRFYTTGYDDGSSPILNMTISPTGNVDILNGNLVVSGGGGYLQGNTVTGNDALYAGSANFVPLGSNVVAQFGANSNGYSQINFQNISDGGLASTDYILTANNGDDSTYFADFGIAGNNHSDSAFFGDTTTANDAYLYVVGADAAGPGGGADGNLILGSTNGTIKMFVGNTAQANVIQTITTSGVIVAGDIIPAANTVYSLGNSTNYWSNLWVANNTIYIGGVALGMTAGNVLTVDGNAVLTNGSNTAVSTTGNITAGNLISPTLNNSGNISVVANGNTWIFGTDGATIFPTLTVTRGDTTGTLTGQALLFGDSAQEALISTPDGVANVTPNSQRLVINPGQGAPGTTGEGGDIYLYAGRGGDAGGSGGDIKIRGGLGPVDGAGGYITMEGGEADVDGIGGYIEIFGGVSGNAAGGTLYIQGGQGRTGGDANVSGGFGVTGPGGTVSIIGGGSANGQAEYGNIFVATGSKNWTFDNTGNLALPQGGVVYETNIPDGGLNGKTIALVPSGGTNADQQLLIYPTVNDANHLHLTTGNLYNTELFLGDDNLYVKLANTGNVVVNSNDGAGNTAQWIFGTDSRLTFPGTPRIDTDANNFEVQAAESISLEANAVVNIYTDTSGTAYQWQFGDDGNLTVPGGMIINGNINTLGSQTALLQPTDDLPLAFIASGANGSVISYWAEDIANLMSSNIAAIYTPLQNTQTVRIVTGTNGGNIAIYDFDKNGVFSTAQVSATGNVTGNYFIGNGSLLTGISASLPVANGTSNFDIATANGNATITANSASTWTFGTDSALTLPASSGQIGRSGYPNGIDLYNNNGGTGYVRMNYADESLISADSGGAHVQTTGGTWDFDTTGNLTAPGNVSAVGNIIGGNIVTSGSGGDITMSGGNITGAGNISAGNLIATGNMVLTGSLIGSGASPAPSLSGFSSVSAITVSASGNITGGGVVTAPVALANLTAIAGGRAFVNNANLVAAGNFGNQVGSGGSNVVPVWSDGSNWYIG